MLILLLMNIIVILSAFLLAAKIFKFNNRVDFIISIFIIYFTQIILTELILGLSYALYLKNVILLNSLILLIVWLASRNKKPDFSFKDTKIELNRLLNNRILLFAVSAILSFSVIKIGINLMNPPFGWDSLNYHFTFPVEWLKHGNLDNPITVFDDPSPSYYPINGSLYFLWLMLPLRNVFIADLGQVPFFILAFLCVYNIARKIGLEREISFFAAALFLLVPNFFKQLQIAYVDVMVAALFLTCVNFLFSLDENFSWQNALIYSLSLGLLLGTKTVALPYSVLLFIPFIYLLFRNLNKSYLFLISIAAIAALGGFTYIRNFIETGNPLYPLDFFAGGESAFGGKLFVRPIFKGVMDKSVYSAHFKLQDYSLFKVLFHEGLGMQTLIFVFPAIFLGLPAAFIKNKKSFSFNFVYFLILPVFIYLIYRYIIPLANTRYLYPLLGIGMVIGFYAARLLNIRRSIINVLAVISVLASMSELAKRRELIASVVTTFLLLFLLPFLIRYFRQKAAIKKPVVIFLFFILIIGSLIWLEKDYAKNEFPRYIKMVKYSGFWPDAASSWDWLNSNTVGNNIAYAGRPVPFPLYGSNFKNNVYYVSVNKTEPAKLHYFPGSRYRWGYDFLSLHKNLEAKGNYRADADYSVWLNNLARRDIDYLFVYSLHQTKNIEFPFEDKWARENPLKFIPVFGNETIHIYKAVK